MHANACIVLFVKVLNQGNKIGLRAFGFPLGAKLVSIARALMLVAKGTGRNTLTLSATNATILETSVLKPRLSTPSSASTPTVYLHASYSSYFINFNIRIIFKIKITVCMKAFQNGKDSNIPFGSIMPVPCCVRNQSIILIIYNECIIIACVSLKYWVYSLLTPEMR